MDPNKDKLKTLKVLDISYAKRLKVMLENGPKSQQKVINITEGKILPESGVGTILLDYSK